MWRGTAPQTRAIGVNLNRGWDERTCVQREFSPRYWPNSLICNDTGRGKLPISSGLAEFVLQNSYSHAFCSPVVVLGRKSASLSTASARGLNIRCVVELSVRPYPCVSRGDHLPNLLGGCNFRRALLRQNSLLTGKTTGNIAGSTTLS